MSVYVFALWIAGRFRVVWHRPNFHISFTIIPMRMGWLYELTSASEASLNIIGDRLHW